MEDGSCVMIPLEEVGGISMMSGIDCVAVPDPSDCVRALVGSVRDPVGLLPEQPDIARQQMIMNAPSW